VLWFGLVTLPSKARTWYRERYHGTELVGSVGFKLVPNMQQLHAYQRMEGEAHKRCLDERTRHATTTLEARVDQILERVLKVEADGRANFEAINGRLDEFRTAESPPRSRGGERLSHSSPDHQSPKD